jgi:hypothetical protein
MTAQASDKFIFNGREYAVVGIHNSKYANLPGAKTDVLFSPHEFDLKPIGVMSACWRGYICEYGIQDNKLVVENLRVWLEKPGHKINGVTPILHREGSRLYIYKGLNENLDFTGGVLIADDFIKELYVHMGFHPAWKFREVVELIFDRGEIVDTRDVSEQMEKIRNEMVHKPLQPGLEEGEERIKSWIESTFSLDYDL